MARWQIECCDAVVGMSMFSPGSVGAVLMDPPYCAGSIKEAGRKRATHQGLRSETIREGRFQWFENDNMGTSGLSFLLRAVALRAAEAVGEVGQMGVFCDWRMMTAIQPAIESAGWSFRGLVVWDKGSMGLGVGFRPQHELVLHFIRGKVEYGSKSHSNVLRHRRPGSERIHPTEKPVPLLKDLIAVLSQPGDLIVDPFCGSGSTGEAALKTGRRFVGFDRSPEFARASRERLEALG